MSRIAMQTKDETKRNIEQAFLELYRTKRLEQITISAISEKAGLNRSTFYYYFVDIYDLLEYVENKYIDEATKIIPILIDGIIQNNLEENIAMIQEFYKKNRDTFLLFLVERPNVHIIQASKKIAREYALHYIGIDKDKLGVREKCIMEYIANAQIGIISWWLENDRNMEFQILIDIIKQANLRGPMTLMMNLGLEDLRGKWKENGIIPNHLCS